MLNFVSFILHRFMMLTDQQPSGESNPSKNVQLEH